MHPPTCTILGPALYAGDLLFLAQQDPRDRRYWHCSILGARLSLRALHVVDDHGNLVAVEGWRS